MPRPTKLNAESQAQIVKAIEAGATRNDAAVSAGVKYETFLNWMKRGEASKSGEYFEFFNLVTAAEANVRVSLANALAVAAKTDWRAAVDYLKRRDPKNWGDKERIELAGDATMPLTVRVVYDNDEPGNDSPAPEITPSATADTQ